MNGIKNVLLAFILFIAVVPLKVTGQVNDTAVEAVWKEFYSTYNAGNSDAVYALLDTGFHAKITKKDVVSMLGELYGANGKFTSWRLLHTKDRAYTFLVKSEKDTIGFRVSMSIDQGRYINYLLFTPGPEDVPVRKRSVKEVTDSLMKRYISRVNTVGISVGVINHDRIVITHLGETYKGLSIKPTDSTIYEVGSISKTFTATLVAYYVSQGRLKLSDPIVKYLPDSVRKNKKLSGITISMLLNHTAGFPSLPSNIEDHMPDSLNPYKDYTNSHLFSYLSQCEPVSSPGSKFTYSNLTLALAGVILERISGKSYENMVSELICRPLKMRETIQHFTPVTKVKFAPAHDDLGEPVKSWDFLAFAGAGSLKSSIRDMLAYIQANMSPDGSKLGKAIAATHIQSSTVEPVGLGWFIARAGAKGDKLVYWHNGGTGGSHAFTAFCPATHQAVIVLANAFEDADFVGSGIMNALLDE